MHFVALMIVLQCIHVLNFFIINNVLYKPQEKKSRAVKSGELGQGIGPPLFLSNNKETPCPEKHEHDRRSEVMHHVTLSWDTVWCGTPCCHKSLPVSFRYLFQCCLVWIHLIKFVSYTGVGSEFL